MNKGLGTMPQDDANLTDLAFINRQLHATIEAMRVKLEAEHQARDDRIAQAHAVIAEEHRGLQNAIQAMRIQLELQQANHDGKRERRGDGEAWRQPGRDQGYRDADHQRQNDLQAEDGNASDHV